MTSAPLNIAHFRATAQVRGLERNTLQQLVHENARGHRAWLITTRRSPLRALGAQAGVEVVGARVFGDANPLTPFLVASLLRRRDGQMLHLHGSHASYVAALGAKLARVPVIATLHSLYGRRAYDGAQHLIAVSAAVRDHMVAQGVPAARISVVYNGVDVTCYAPRPRDAAIAALGLDPDRRYFAVIGMLSGVKGVMETLEVFARLHAAHPDAGLLYAGEGPLRGALEAAIQEKRLGGAVTLFGFLDDVRPVIAACDCLVLNSTAREGLPQVVLQAMAMARPAVAADIGGTREVMRHERTGLLVPPHDPAALARALEFVLTNPAWREDAAHAGLARVAADFSLAAQLDGIERVYRMFLGATR